MSRYFCEPDFTGEKRRIAVTAPAAGANFTYAISPGSGSEIWHIEAINFDLATSGAAGTRNVRLSMGDFETVSSYAHPSGTTVRYRFNAGMGQFHNNDAVTVIGGGAALYMEKGLPPFPYYVHEGQSIASAFVGLDANDQISNIVIYAHVWRAL